MRSSILLTLAAVVITIGCAKNDDSYVSDDSMYNQFPSQDVTYDPNVMEVGAQDSTWTDSTYGSSTSADSGISSSQYGTGSRTHVVKAKDTLYGLARMYYNDARQWKKIYQANEDRISDPNKISIGMELIIP